MFCDLLSKCLFLLCVSTYVRYPPSTVIIFTVLHFYWTSETQTLNVPVGNLINKLHTQLRELKKRLHIAAYATYDTGQMDKNDKWGRGMDVSQFLLCKSWPDMEMLSWTGGSVVLFVWMV